jgi:tRNA(fMet)-specific endonuclease VapC
MAKKSKKLVLLDTNILINILRGAEKEIQVVKLLGYEQIAISTISVLEVYYGMFKNEEKETKNAIKKFVKLHLDKEISQKAVEIMLAHSNMRPALPDCLIAATCIVYNAQLFTHNTKDFDYIKGVKLYKPKTINN